MSAMASQITCRSRHSQPKRTSMLVTKFEKLPPFADSGWKKHPLSSRNRWFRGPIKQPPFLKQNSILFHYIWQSTSFMKARRIVSNWRHLSIYVVFFIMSNVCLSFEYICVCLRRPSLWPNVNPGEYRQIYAKFIPLFKISLIYAWKITHFSWFRQFVLPNEKNAPFFAKIGTSMGVRLGREWEDGGTGKQSTSRLFSQSFVQAQIKDNIKASRHWRLRGGIHRWPVVSLTIGQ